MSPVSQLTILAFAAGALAVPGYRNVAHNHGHQHLHSAYSSGSAVGTGSGVPFPYPTANATGIYGSTGTGLATGSAAPSGFSSVASSPVGTVTVTVVPYVADAYSSVAASSSAEAYSSVAASSADAASTTLCTTDVTVTTTQRTYITVTATEQSSSSVEVSAIESSTSSARKTMTQTVHSTVHITLTSSSSAVVSSVSEAASSSAYPILSTYSAVGKGYNQWTRSTRVPSSAVSSASSTSVYVAPTTSSTSTSVYVAPTTSSSSVYVAPTTSSVALSSASSTVSTVESVATGTTGKRGLAYNDASLTDCLTGSQVSWAYNWGSATTGLASGLNFIPLLWGTASDFTSSWSANAAAAIASGSTHLMSFNEPDLSSQANLSPEAAAEAYKTYMMPFAGQAKLCAPSVTNGGGEMGLTWLMNFMTACSDCQIDCVSIHWYDTYSNVESFKNQVTNATTISGKEVFVSEFGSTDGSDDDISTFLQDVMPWMDSNDDVAGYAYFMVADGMLVSGTEPSTYGSTYLSYTS
ncbi:hypothetical protein LTR08_005842 [Meristemomyces frigidus]|nr:hypothetical protein LTR08_005842 [Meristemomyces frigidus]